MVKNTTLTHARKKNECNHSTSNVHPTRNANSPLLIHTMEYRPYKRFNFFYRGTSIASTNSSTHFYMQLKRGRNELNNQLTQCSKIRHDTKITTSYDRFSRGDNLYIRLVKRNAILLIPTPGVLITRGKLGRHTWKILLIYHQSDNMKYGNVLHQDRNQTVPITQQLTDPKRRLRE